MKKAFVIINSAILYHILLKLWLHLSSIKCFLSECPAKMLSCDVILHAVLKSTREYWAIVRGRVFPWYKGKGTKRGKTSKFEWTLCNNGHKPRSPYFLSICALWLYVHSHFNVFPFQFPFPYTEVTLSPSLLLSIVWSIFKLQAKCRHSPAS